MRSTTDPSEPPSPPLCQWWRPRQIAYVVNVGAYQGGCADPGAAAALIRASFLPWMSATRPGASAPCTDFKFRDGGDSTRTDLGYDKNDPGGNANLVVVRSGLCSARSDPICHPSDPQDIGPCVEKYNCWSHGSNAGGGGILALTTTTVVQSTGEIVDADLELNGWNGSLIAPAGFYFTCATPGGPVCSQSYGGAGCIAYDLGNTVTHEAGHMLGLGHSPVPEATMAPTASIGSTDKRTLAADDVDGVCTVYPAGGATSTCMPGGGCGTPGAGSLSLAGLGLLLLRRRCRV